MVSCCGCPARMAYNPSLETKKIIWIFNPNDKRFRISWGDDRRPNRWMREVRPAFMTSGEIKRYLFQ
ncbi:expressed protein, partial [Phakopsora pachyrhizi]